MNNPIYEEATLKALNESIEHWERLATGTSEKNESMFGSDCALCMLHYEPKEDSKDTDEEGCGNCEGCPVQEKTGQPECYGSPWHIVYKQFHSIESKGTESFKKAARLQCDFLKSLLPKGQP